MSVDASGLYPEVMTKLERRRNALALLQGRLTCFREASCRSAVGRPRVEKLGNTTTAFGIELVIRVDPKKYEAFQDRMTRLLPCLSKRDGTVEADGKTVARAWEPARQQLLRNKFLNAGMRGPGDMGVVDMDFTDIEDLSARAISGVARQFHGAWYAGARQGRLRLEVVRCRRRRRAASDERYRDGGIP